MERDEEFCEQCGEPMIRMAITDDHKNIIRKRFSLNDVFEIACYCCEYDCNEAVIVLKPKEVSQ